MTTPVKSIRKKCLDCCCGQMVEVRLCPCKDCALWGYRLGHRPKKTSDSLENSEEKDFEVVE